MDRKKVASGKGELIKLFPTVSDKNGVHGTENARFPSIEEENHSIISLLPCDRFTHSSMRTGLSDFKPVWL